MRQFFFFWFEVLPLHHVYVFRDILFSGNLMPEAELITMLWEIVCQFPGLLDKNCTVRVNHYSLVTGILLHCGVEIEKHDHVCALLRRMKASEFKIKTRTNPKEIMCGKQYRMISFNAELATHSLIQSDLLSSWINILKSIQLMKIEFSLLHLNEHFISQLR